MNDCYEAVKALEEAFQRFGSTISSVSKVLEVALTPREVKYVLFPFQELFQRKPLISKIILDTGFDAESTKNKMEDCFWINDLIPVRFCNGFIVDMNNNKISFLLTPNYDELLQIFGRYKTIEIYNDGLVKVRNY